MLKRQQQQAYQQNAQSQPSRLDQMNIMHYDPHKGSMVPGVGSTTALMSAGREETPNSSLPRQHHHQQVMKRISDMQMNTRPQQQQHQYQQQKHSSASDLTQMPEWKRQLIEKKRNKMMLQANS